MRKNNNDNLFYRWLDLVIRKGYKEAGISAGLYYYEWTKSLFPGWNFVWLGFWLWEMKWILALLTKQIENEVDIYFGNID